MNSENENENENMKKQNHYRQGDVLIEQVETIPSEAKRQKKSASVVLAHGEVTGHHHVLETEDPADWWKRGEISDAAQKPAAVGGEIFVALPDGGSVKHDEHATIDLPAGTYRITRQREYAPDAIRNVAD